MRPPTQHFYEFGPFRLEATERRLLRDGEAVPLTAKVFDILLILVQNHGHLLEKDALLQAVWPDSFVEESNLTRSVSTLRKALGEGDGEYIETVPKRGYRFVASVREWSGAETGLFVQERISASVVIEEEEEADSHSVTRTEIVPAQTRQLERWTSRRRRWLGIIVGVLLIGLVVGLAYWWKSSRAKPTGTVAAIKSIAVLPFKPLLPEEGNEYLGLGLADTVITKLSSLKSLVVRPTSAVLKYGHSTQDPLAAGREQHVDAVLDANFQRDGERIRVSVRLLSVHDGKTLWAYQCDELLCNNLFAMQDVITEQVAAALMPLLTGEERLRLQKHYTDNREAYHDYAKGLFFWNKRTLEGFKKGIEYYEKAIAKDPDYALAYAGLANCYNGLASFGMAPSKESFPKSKLAVLKALAIDDELGEAYASLAQILHLYEWNWTEAEREFKRAIELNPGYSFAHLWYGIYLCQLGRFDEGKAEMKRAVDMDPASLDNNFVYAHSFYWSRDYDQEIVIHLKTIELHPNWPLAHFRLALVYELKGMYDHAFAEYLTHHTLMRHSPEWIEEFKKAYAASGIRGYWQKRVAFVNQASAGKYRSKLGHALDYIHLGEKEEALHWLQQACDDRDTLMVTLKVDPLFDGLRADPRFADLLRRVGLAP